jgi:hypothetical protein
MNKKMAFLSIIVILVLALTGCQSAQSAQASSSANGAGAPAARQFNGTPPAGFNPGGAPGSSAAATATPTAVATQKPTATATATAVPVTAAAVSQAKAYFADLQNKDFTAASKLISIVSLSYAGLTRMQAASSLQAQSLAGAGWSNLQIVDSQVFSDDTILVHVIYTVGTTTGTATPQATANATPEISANAVVQASATTTAAAQKDEVWAFRLESGSYLYNWGNFIDTKTVEVGAQTANHITLQPTRLVRFTDRLELHFMMQNKTSDVVYFVQSYDTLAVFHFSDQAVEAKNSDNKVVISGLRTSYDEKIVVKGLYTSYPTWVEIKKFDGYYPNPWYTFQF